MKKTIIAVLALTVALGLGACSSEAEKKETVETSAVTATAGEAQSNATAESAKETESETNAAETTDWETFLKEYEAWVDKYVALMEKYNANPTDVSLLSDYGKLAEEATEWSKKADDVQVKLENDPKALQEYLETLGRITEKLAGIAY